MKRAGFSLIELLIGLVISLFLAFGMAFFVGNASYGFHSHKSIVKDRGQLKKGLHILSHELMEIGIDADEDGRIVIGANSVFYIDLASDALGNAVLTYWIPNDDMDRLASADPTVVYSWDQVEYRLALRPMPVTGDQVLTLLRNGVPVVIGVDNFGVELGVDLNDDGIIDELADEWIQDPPLTQNERELVYGKLLKLRLTLANRTQIQDGDPVVNRTTQEIYLRNRGNL